MIVEGKGLYNFKSNHHFQTSEKDFSEIQSSMDSILDKLRGAKYINKIDLKNAYLQVL